MHVMGGLILPTRSGELMAQGSGLQTGPGLGRGAGAQEQTAHPGNRKRCWGRVCGAPRTRPMDLHLTTWDSRAPLRGSWAVQGTGAAAGGEGKVGKSHLGEGRALRQDRVSVEIYACI